MVVMALVIIKDYVFGLRLFFNSEAQSRILEEIVAKDNRVRYK